MTPVGDAAVGAFEFATAGRIVFGAGRARELASLAAGHGRRVLVVVGAKPGRHAALLQLLETPGGIESLEVFSLAREPTVAMAESGAARARAMRADLVVGIGGGSVLDGAKAIAALATNPDPAIDYLEVVGRGRPLARPALPVIAVPTTAGTGAEVTRNAVLSVPEAHVKVSLRSPSMLPRVALVDPELAVSLPPATTAATGLDAITQLIEPFLSCRANPLSDALCLDGIARAARSLRLAFREQANVAARAEMALAALYSGMALANAGLGVIHGLAASIGGLLDAPHGAICAALLPHGLRANLSAVRSRHPAHPCLGRFGILTRILTGNANARPDDVITWTSELVRELEIPPLSNWGLRPEDIPGIADRAAEASSMKANPVALSATELRDILERAL